MSPSLYCKLRDVSKLLPSLFSCPWASGRSFADSMWTLSTCCRCREGEPDIPCTLDIETNCWISTIPPRAASSIQYGGNRQEVVNPRSQEGVFCRPLLPADGVAKAEAGAVASRRVVFDSRCLFEDCRRTDPCNGPRPDGAIFYRVKKTALSPRNHVSSPVGTEVTREKEEILLYFLSSIGGFVRNSFGLSGLATLMVLCKETVT